MLDSPEFLGRAPNPCGGCCQEGSDELDIFSNFVNILTVGNLDVYIETSKVLMTFLKDYCTGWLGCEPGIFVLR
jgi:hypothetical protein